ncbi:hypothetical protein KPL70_010278 [Citrus sinensis]|uniref:Uncharacterized protein n=1 Tax=Citrus clementina TaxID=85681 RepID=V4VXP9_CITCL|nr:hypothetical protein CICLE_v10021974mg [Citrus x clementina]KAH9732435.1 hypothetical protein KPL70_010278 [Citrus sinensis]
MAFLVSPPEFSTKIFFNPNPHSTSQKSLSVLSNHEKLGSRARVRVSGISEVGRNVRLYGQFSAPVKPSKEEEEKHNYYVNMGYAIRTLREEFPALFYRELSFDIYRIFFRALWLDIISVWQPLENVIMVRWTIHGVPRVPWESRGRFDGTSEYKLDRNGKIYEHRVDNIALNSPPPKFRVLAVEDLIQSIGCPSTPKPTYFEISSSDRT